MGHIHRLAVILTGQDSVPNASEAKSQWENIMQDTLFADQDFNVWVLLIHARDAIFKAREKELDKYGISTMESAVLFIVQAIGDKATPAEISRWIIREPHSVSGLLDRMEKKGLIRKTKDLDRKNLVRVSLTKKGKQAYNKSARRRSVHHIISALSEEERQQLSSYLRILRNRALKELGIDHEPPFPPAAAI